MSCASISFLKMRNLPYDRLKDLCENHEKFSSSKPEVQNMLCELLSRDQEQEPICQERLIDRKVSEIIRTIAYKAMESGLAIDRRVVLSLAGRAVSTAIADQTEATAENISSFLLLETMEECASQVEELQRWEEEDGSRSEAAQIILSFLTEPTARSISLCDQRLSSLPRLVSKKMFFNLRFLHLCNNKLKKFPELSAIKALDRLTLSGNEISTVPVDAEGIGFIQEIYLDSNQITVVPDNLMAFRSLKIFSIARNQIRTIPVKVSFPDSLKVLILNKNRISAIPRNLEGLGRVKKLYLGDNPITELPGSFKGLEEVEILSLSGNKISKFPEKIEGLGNLKTLYLWMDSPPSIRFLQARGLRSLEYLVIDERGEVREKN